MTAEAGSGTFLQREQFIETKANDSGGGNNNVTITCHVTSQSGVLLV